MENLDAVSIIVTALLAFIGALLTYRTSRIEGEARNDREALTTLTEAYERLVDQHQEEINRHREQRRLDREEALVDRERLLKKIEELNTQVDGMDRLYKEESERWGIERQEMEERIDTQDVQIKGLIDHNVALLRELEALKKQAAEYIQERENLLDRLTTSQAEIERQDARILILETARNDGKAPELAGEPLPE